MRHPLLRRTAGVLGLAGFAAAGCYLVPLMQSVQIGAAIAETGSSAAEPVSPAVTAPSAESAESAEPQPVTVTLPHQDAAAPADAAIGWESEGSAAMHAARPYLNPLTDPAGTVVRKYYGAQSSSIFFPLDGGGQVRNSTFWSNADLAAESRILPNLDLKIDGTPMVLIYHTHTTESYQETDAGIYDKAFNFRTTDPDKNVVMVGDAIAAQLTAAGIGVVHTQEIHDYPVWNKSYTRSAETVKAILKQYPSICIALDIHRDALSSGTTVYAPTTEIDGQKTAQIMIISGCDNGSLNMPNYRENFHLASILQQTAETMYPGLTRPLLFDYRKYNQDLTTGSLLIEVGSQGSTMEEARRAGELTGKVIAEVITKLAGQQ